MLSMLAFLLSFVPQAKWNCGAMHLRRNASICGFHQVIMDIMSCRGGGCSWIIGRRVSPQGSNVKYNILLSLLRLHHAEVVHVSEYELP